MSLCNADSVDADTSPADNGFRSKHGRVIIHFDIDAFYAQVEMLKNPDLAKKPMGVNQKHCVVTSNYIAREFGVKKCMSVTRAKELCPNLILVNGEDLGEYRKYSDLVNEVLRNYVPIVEKLGLDENFIDVTNLVQDDETELEFVEVVGNVYGDDMENCNCGCYRRLCCGSRLAKTIREKIKEKTGLTTSCGISYNKLLAKIVGQKNKPFNQTTVFPKHALNMVQCLGNIRALPGIGARYCEVLDSLNIKTVIDLQSFSVKILGDKLNSFALATKFKQLAYAIDESVVKNSDRPKSYGVEDASRIDNKTQLLAKTVELLAKVQKLLVKDGRQPSTITVTIRKVPSTQYKESRQTKYLCNPNSLDFCNPEKQTAKTILNLVNKMVDLSKPFHLKLLGISFGKLSSSQSQSVKTIRNKTIMGSSKQRVPNACESSSNSKDQLESLCSQFGYDETVFKQLPNEIQKEFIPQKIIPPRKKVQKSILDFIKK